MSEKAPTPAPGPAAAGEQQLMLLKEEARRAHDHLTRALALAEEAIPLARSVKDRRLKQDLLGELREALLLTEQARGRFAEIEALSQEDRREVPP